ncbi:hypothetical protein DKX38_027019 [Salix brachista]|uniref:Uncharacterized protein n=1 Tax=Salix brachista TaxID=2182728 RepID=A0A5N5JB54_9ROSI|nr:hypothetical protein DKX38_027019 [Salix brachista]
MRIDSLGWILMVSSFVTEHFAACRFLTHYTFCITSPLSELNNLMIMDRKILYKGPCFTSGQAEPWRENDPLPINIWIIGITEPYSKRFNPRCICSFLSLIELF